MHCFVLVRSHRVCAKRLRLGRRQFDRICGQFGGIAAGCDRDVSSSMIKRNLKMRFLTLLLHFRPEHAIANGGFGATMRLGRRSTVFLTQNSILRQIYERETDRNAIGGDECGRQRAIVEERHRHRYEVNPAHVPTMMQA